MREDLIGYLLAALEPHEMRDIERALKNSPALREELEFLRSQMAPIDEAIGGLPLVDAPSDLVRRTMDLIPTRESMELAGVDAATLELSPVPFTSRLARGFSRAHRSDWIVAMMSAAAVVALLLPALSHIRNQSRITLCQDQLRQLGQRFPSMCFVIASRSCRRSQKAASKRLQGCTPYDLRTKGYSSILRCDGVLSWRYRRRLSSVATRRIRLHWSNQKI